MTRYNHRLLFTTIGAAVFLAGCSSTPPYRPVDFNSFFQGQWVMEEYRCNRKGICKKSGKGTVMVVEDNKIAMVKDAETREANSVLVYRFGPADRLRLTNVETGRTFLGSVYFLTDRTLLLESRRVPASFEKWRRLQPAAE